MDNFLKSILDKHFGAIIISIAAIIVAVIISLAYIYAPVIRANEYLESCVKSYRLNGHDCGADGRYLLRNG